MSGDFLREKIAAQYGAEAEKIFEGFRVQRVTSFRVNPLKSSAEQIESALFRAQIPFRRAEWYRDAFLISRNDYEKLIALPMYGSGEIYVQSLSSMLPPLFLNPRPKERILDMTAAPGGKTTQLFSLSGGRALITACERDKTRFQRLKFNLERQGASNVQALCTDAASLNEYFRFDKILLDAPCSGSGTVREGEGVDERLLSRCVAAQRKLLLKAVSLLREGGTLLYSTCSLLREENEEQILWLLKETKCRIEPLDGGTIEMLPGLEGTLTVCPNSEFEGFFLCKLVK